MAFCHFLEKAEWRNDAFRYFPQHSATFRISAFSRTRTWGGHNHEIKIWLFLNNILHKVIDSCYFPTKVGHWGYSWLGSSFFTFVESLCWPSNYDFQLGGISKYHVIGTYHSRLWFEDTGTVKPEINAGSCLPSNLYLYCTTCKNCHSQKNHLSVKVNLEALFLAFTVVCRTPFLSLAQCHYISKVLVYVYLLIL